MKILIINGPNLNLLGQRETEIYGNSSFEEYFEELNNVSEADLEYFQSNHEGEIIDKLQSASQSGVIINAGGYTHSSVAIRDCIAAIDIPVVEVHISNIAGRESFRHESLISPVCEGCIFGFGLTGYQMAVDYFLKKR
jgi:3-dehydroquinate dehydratase-2